MIARTTGAVAVEAGPDGSASRIARVQIHYLPGCPRLDPLRALLDQVLARSGVACVVEEIPTTASPSPTLFVDGLDVTGRSVRAGGGRACRLDLPTEAQIAAALPVGTREEAGTAMAFSTSDNARYRVQRTGLSAEHLPRRRRIGRLGTWSRAVIGTALLGVGALGTIRPDGVDWIKLVIGAAALPALIVAAGAIVARYRPAPLRLTGPVGTGINCMFICALASNTVTGPSIEVFYGLTILAAAWGGRPGCEVTMPSNLALGRDDQLGCPLFTPIDHLEQRRKATSASAQRRDPKPTNPTSSTERATSASAEAPRAAITAAARRAPSMTRAITRARDGSARTARDGAAPAETWSG